MIKLTGCLLIFLSCCYGGFLRASTYKARSTELENIREIIKLLDIEITYRKDPLAKTFRKVSSQKYCWFSCVLKSCSRELEKHCSLEEAWSSALTEWSSRSPLIQQDIVILEDMALGIGKSDADGQSRILEPVLLRIADQLILSRDLERKQGRMYKGLGAAIGVVIVIMII